MFSFPPMLADGPYRENWYQDLLDDPACQNDPVKIQQAYESNRSKTIAQGASDLKRFANSLQTLNESKPDQQPPYAKITLLQSPGTGAPGQLRLHEPGIDPNDTQLLSVNCMGIWARPNRSIINMISNVQHQLKQHVGEALYSIPVSHLHLSVCEFSHRHEQSYLEKVHHQLGTRLVQELLDLPVSMQQKANALQSSIRLVKPQVCFDKAGIALTFVPDTFRPDGQTDQLMTYHHLRNEFHKAALSTGIHIDTCYTAATAHVTIARFVDEPFSNDKGEDAKITTYMELFQEINDNLEKTMWPSFAWDLTDGPGLEYHMGYLKFGAERKFARMVSSSSVEN